MFLFTCISDFNTDKLAVLTQCIRSSKNIKDKLISHIYSKHGRISYLHEYFPESETLKSLILKVDRFLFRIIKKHFKKTLFYIIV